MLILFAPPMLLLVHRSVVFQIFSLFFYLRIFTDKKILRCDNTINNMVFEGFFLLSRFRLMFLTTTFSSFPPGVTLPNYSTAQRDSTIHIEKTLQKGAPERE